MSIGFLALAFCVVMSPIAIVGQMNGNKEKRVDVKKTDYHKNYYTITEL